MSIAAEIGGILALAAFFMWIVYMIAVHGWSGN